MRAENLSEKTKVRRNDYSREYKESQRRAKGVPRRNLTTPRFDGPKLAAYLQRFIIEDKEEEDQVEHTYLNGVLLTSDEVSYINKLKKGTVRRATFGRIDELALQFDLPLWELIEAAGVYKEDIRTIRRRRRKAT